MTKIAEVLQAVNNICSEKIQEKWDNSGLQWGDTDAICSGVTLSLDVTLDVIEEAQANGCNLIIAHHPLLFSPLKHISKSGNEVERLAFYCIQNGISVYAAHTNWDKVKEGVSWVMAKRIGLSDTKILCPESGALSNVKVLGKSADLQAVREAWFDAGLAQIGEYSNCSFTTDGWGTFQPSASASPAIGQANVTQFEREQTLEICVPNILADKAVSLAKQISSYETLAYSIIPLSNTNDELGFGCIGILPEAMNLNDFLALCKEQYACKTVRYNSGKENSKIKKVAVCGGSAVDFVRSAIAQKADAYITADIKYHQFTMADRALTLVDVGHYESEIWAMEHLTSLISEKFHNFAVRLTTINTNSIRYF
jgi:dinuclear metal center YbgI/SA1388 family protein